MEPNSQPTQSPARLYTPPQIVTEIELETRAGSPLRLPPDLLPGSAPFGTEK